MIVTPKPTADIPTIYQSYFGMIGNNVYITSHATANTPIEANPAVYARYV